MADADRYVIGAAHTDDPWVLNLEPMNESRAEQSIRWQRIGQGQFDPPDYWKIVTHDELVQLLPTMSRSPYTEEAWDRFVQQVTRSQAA